MAIFYTSIGSVAAMELEENAVSRGKTWLLSQQQGNGSWLSKNLPAAKVMPGVTNESKDVLVTAHAILALLAGGSWQLTDQERQAIIKGVVFLLQNQGEEGDFGPIGWTHPMCLWAINEARALAKDPQMSEAVVKGVRWTIQNQIHDPANQLPLGWPGTMALPRTVNIPASMWNGIALASVHADNWDSEFEGAVQTSLSGLLSLSALIEQTRSSQNISIHATAHNLNVVTMWLEGSNATIGDNAMLRILSNEIDYSAARRRIKAAAQPYYLAKKLNFQQATLVAWADLCNRHPSWLDSAKDRWRRQLEVTQLADHSWNFPAKSWHGEPLGPVADTSWALLMLQASLCRSFKSHLRLGSPPRF